MIYWKNFEVKGWVPFMNKFLCLFIIDKNGTKRFCMIKFANRQKQRTYVTLKIYQYISMEKPDSAHLSISGTFKSLEMMASSSSL